MEALPHYDVDAHGILTKNMKTFQVPKNTAIVHFNIPGLSTIMPRQGTLGPIMTNVERRRLLAGKQFRDNAYSVIYVEGDTIPDVDMQFQCMFSRTGIYDVKQKKAIVNKEPTAFPNNDNVTCTTKLSSIITEQGSGVYFVTSCRPMHPNARNTKKLLELQKRNLQARARYNTGTIKFYEKFIGSSRNAGNVLSRILSGYLPGNSLLVNTTRKSQFILGLVHKLSKTMTYAQVAYPTYRACEHFNMELTMIPVLLCALFISFMINMSFGQIPVYATARGMSRIRCQYTTVRNSIFKPFQKKS
jgi:hypothetical protein